MTSDFTVQLLRQMLTTALWVSAPLLLIGFVAGIAVSLVQLVTSIQDSAFNAVPRLAAFLAGMVLLMPWMLSKLMAYTVMLMSDLGRYAH